MRSWRRSPSGATGLGYLSCRRDRLYLLDGETAEAVTDEYTQVTHFAAENGAVLFAAHRFSGKEGKTSGVYLWRDGSMQTLVEDGVYAVDWVGFAGGSRWRCSMT